MKILLKNLPPYGDFFDTFTIIGILITSIYLSIFFMGNLIGYIILSGLISIFGLAGLEQMDSASKIFTVTFIIFIWGFTIVYGGLISKSPEKAKKISSYFNITIAILSVSAIFGPMLYEYFTK